MSLPSLPQKKHQRHSTILWIEGAGFCVIIVFAWLAEALRVPQIMFAEPESINWVRPLAKTVVIFCVWACVHVATRRLLKRLYYLEDFLLLCGWCRKIGHDGEWKTTEEYFGSVFATETSHGVCPECSKRLVESFGSDAARSGARVSPQVQRTPHP
jgi:hypothetical protein